MCILFFFRLLSPPFYAFYVEFLVTCRLSRLCHTSSTIHISSHRSVELQTMTTSASYRRALPPALPPEDWDDWPLRDENLANVRAQVMVRNERYNQEHLEEVYLMRGNNPRFAYKKHNRKKYITLGGDGKLFFCIQLPRINDGDGELVFSEPIKPKFVAVKRLIRTGIAGFEQKIQEGSQDNPYHEIVAMLNSGQLEEDPERPQHMMNLVEALWGARYLYIITPVAVEIDSRGGWECCGDFHRIIRWNRGGCTEEEARYCFLSVVKNMKYMQQNRLCHRDLKGGNIVVKTRGEGSTTLIDFAMSLKVPHVENIPRLIQNNGDMLCGTRGYLTPEVANRRDFDGYLIDVFALGAILFNLLTGEKFLDNNQSNTYPVSSEIQHILMKDCVYEYFVRNNGLKEDVPIPSDLTKPARDLLRRKIKRVEVLSPEARDLLAGMMKYNVQERLTLSQVTGHSWWQSGSSKRPCACTIS